MNNRSKRSSHKIVSPNLILFYLGFLVFIAGFSLTATPRVQALSPNTNVGGPITVDTTWDLAGSPYVMTSIVTVEPGVTLTIEPGVTVQGGNGRMLIVEGDLQAVGTAAQPIHFTSSTNTGPYQWNGIAIDGGTGVLEHIVLRYAGDFTNAYQYSALTIRDSAGVTIRNAEIYDNDAFSTWIHKTFMIENSFVTITDSTFHDNGVDQGQDAALQIVSGTVTVDNTTFQNNGGSAILARGTVTVTTTTFENNGHLGLRLEPDDWARAENLTFINDPAGLTAGTMVEDTIFPTAWGVDYFRLIETVTVAPTATLTIEPGNEIRGQVGTMLIVEGDLQALGSPSQPITFTSVTNTGTDQWNGVAIDGGTATLNHITLRYAGSFTNEYGRNALTIRDSAGEVTLQNAEIHDNDAFSVSVHRTVVIENSTATIKDSNFHDNGGEQPSDAALQVSVDSLVTIENTNFLNNGGQGLLTSQPSIVTVSTSNFSANDGSGINAYGTLTITDSTFENHSGIGLNLNTDHASVTCASFLNNAEGMRINTSVDPFFLGGSTFSGNTSFGLNNLSGAIVDATYNYWGDPSGPSGNGPGSGDAVSTFVLYAPWLTSDECAVQVGGLQASNDSPTIETLATDFSATVSQGSTVIYDWDFGDGASAQGQFVSHVYPAAGAYTATVVASNIINAVTATTAVEILPRPSFGGVVWEDGDGDGVQGPGEPGLSGATVTASGPSGNFQGASTNGGAYQVNTLATGWFTITATLAGYQPSTLNPASAPLPEDGSAQVDFGLILAPAANQGRITGRIFADINGNGLYDEGELAFGSQLIELWSSGVAMDSNTSDSGGLYSFDNLAAGVYEVRAAGPAGYVPGELIATDLVVTAGKTSFVNLGFVLGGTVGGAVVDAAGDSLEGVALALEQPAGAVFQTANTDGNGGYQLGPVVPGIYFLRITPPPGTAVEDGSELRQILVPNNGAAVENWILEDLGGLVVQAWTTAGPVKTPIAGVQFNITGPNSYFQTGTSDFNGHIWLESLQPGVYTISAITATLPTGAVILPSQRIANVNFNSAATASFSLQLARSISYFCQRNTSTTPPYGPDFPCTVEAQVISDTLGTPPGTLAATTTLAAGGSGTFLDLPIGTYNVSIIPDSSFSGQENWPSSIEQVVLKEQTHAIVRYPFNISYKNNSIWGFAYWDKNLDGKRQSLPGQTADEANQNSSNLITVELFDQNGMLVGTTTTQQHPSLLAGFYEFTGLAAGTYQVRISLPTGFPATTLTTQFREINFIQGTQAANFGYRRFSVQSLTGLVFLDYNGNGQLSKYEDLISGATVKLNTPQGTLVDTTTTFGPTYLFWDVLSGEYVVSLSLPPGIETESKLDKLVALDESVGVFVNFPIVPADQKHRAVVFIDDNLNGVPDDSEQELGGIRVDRYEGACNGTLSGPLDTATTKANGLAVFPNALAEPACARIDLAGSSLPPGVTPADPLGANLPVESSMPVWLPLTPPGTLTVQPFWDIDGDLIKDPNETNPVGTWVTVDAVSEWGEEEGVTFIDLSQGLHEVTIGSCCGMEPAVKLPIQASVTANNATIVPVPRHYPGSISGQVTILGSKMSVEGLTVRAADRDGPEIFITDVAISNGAFLFTNIPGGQYELDIPNPPPGFVLAEVPKFSHWSSANNVKNLTLIPDVAVAGTVYLDTNGNGFRDSSEPGTDQYGIALEADDGSPDQNVAVAGDGSYTLTGLFPGIKYAMSLNMFYSGYGSPDAAITEAPGWFSIGNNNIEANIGVFPWDDASNFNAVVGKVYIQNGTAQQPVAGAQVGFFLRESSCSISDPTILWWAFTSTNGFYRLDTPVLLDGGNIAKYCLRIMNMPEFEQVSTDIVDAGYCTAIPQLGCLSEPSPSLFQENIRLEPMSTSAKSPAGNGSIVTFSAFHDANANSIWDPGEQPLSGVGLGMATTTFDGSGVLIGLADGEHNLVIAAPPGYSSSGPSSRTVFLNGVDLTLAPIPFHLEGAFSGSIFVDFDGDGLRGSGNQERGLEGISVNISGPITASTSTSPNGSFVFFNLPDGDYVLSVVTPAGFENVQDRLVNVSNGGMAAVPLKSLGQVSGSVYEDWDGDGRRGPDEPLANSPITVTLQGVDTTRLFGGHLLFFDTSEGFYTLTPEWSAVAAVDVSLDPATGAAVALPAVDPATVRGTTWHDMNRDGQRQPWETPLSGVSITLDGSQIAITDQQGRFRFLGVAEGQHTLEAQLPAGLEATLPVVDVQAGRGAALGIAATTPGGFQVYLPMTIKE